MLKSFSFCSAFFSESSALNKAKNQCLTHRVTPGWLALALKGVRQRSWVR